MSKHTTLLLMGLLSTGTMAFAQGPPQIVWEADADATNLAFSPDGATMYTGGRQSVTSQTFGNIKQWDVPSTTEVYSLTSNGFGAIGLTNSLAVSPDGTAFVSGHGGVSCQTQGPCTDVNIGFTAWSAASGTTQFALDDSAIDGVVQAVAFSKDGDFVAFTMSRTVGAEIQVYNYPSFTLQGAYDGHGDGTFCAAFSPTDNILATGGWDGTVQLWDVETNQLVRTLAHGSFTNGGYPTSVAFSPDGSQLAVSGRGYNLEATVWDVSTGNLVYGLPVDSGTFGTSSATVAFSPNGRYLVGTVMRYVSPEWQGAIQIWDLVDGSLTRMYEETPIGSTGSPMFVAVSPAASDLIAYTYDYKIKFADTDLDFDSNSPGMSYCGPGAPNSTGMSAAMFGLGSTEVADNQLEIGATGLPPFSFSLFIVSTAQGFVTQPGGSQGNLCLSGAIGRYVGPGQIQQSNLAGNIALTLDITQTPQPLGFVSVAAGETWNYQAWYRDSTPAGPTSNFTDGLSVTFN